MISLSMNLHNVGFVLANMKMLIFRSGDFMRGKSSISIVSLRGAGGIKLRESERVEVFKTFDSKVQAIGHFVSPSDCYQRPCLSGKVSS